MGERKREREKKEKVTDGMARNENENNCSNLLFFSHENVPFVFFHW